MIKNNKQYLGTKHWIGTFEEAIRTMEAADAPVVNWQLHKAQLDGMKSQLVDLKQQVNQYEAAKAGKMYWTTIESIEVIPASLISMRLHHNLTQAGLAKQLGMKAQQIQRYEATEYQSASLATIIKIARVLDGYEMKGL